MNSKIISRTSLDLGDSQIRTIRTGRGKLIYKYTGRPSAKEIKEIDDSLRGAFNMSDYCITMLQKGDEKTNKSFEAIFQKQLDKNSKQSLIQNYKAILQKLISKIVILRESVFVDENGNAVETVLSGANPSEGKTIKIYDAFFKNAKGDDKLLNSRSTVIVHEVAHLIGLHSDEETEMINSAESIRNFTLLACNLVSEKDLFAESGDINSYNSEKKLVGKDGELPYDPNQPKIENKNTGYEDKSNVKILLPSEAKIEVTIATGTTIRHSEYMGKIVPYETNKKKIPFEINCKCKYERKIVEFAKIEKLISDEQKKDLFARKSIGEEGFEISPKWSENECVISKLDKTSLFFNGKKLSLLKNDKEVKFWKAYAGAKNFQSPVHQQVKNKGPLPEGQYQVLQSNIQFWKDATFWRKVIAQVGLGVWKGGTNSWGKGRVLLTPDKKNKMYGRDGFTIHGGVDPYSQGCIDLVQNELDFISDFKKIGVDMILEVKY